MTDSNNKNSDQETFPKIPGFTILKNLGRGGMARVYLATQDSMEREVAIKVMLPQLLADPSFGDRFLREARIAAKLAHPHIVAIIDVSVANDLYYMAMEYHPGGDLSTRIREGLPEKDVIHIIKEIAGALDYAHTNGFLHRDIKPDNILFSRSGSVVLSDFGIARAADSGTKLTATGSMVGTPHYMSPEQAMGTTIDGRADLYSLGVMFYQMLVGKVPFDGESAMSIGIKHIRDPIPTLPPHLARYQTFLEKLVAKDPDERWQSAADVVRTLEVLEIKDTPAGSDTLGGTAINSTAISDQAPATHTSGQNKKSTFGIVVGTLVIVAIGAVVVWQQGLVGRGDTDTIINTDISTDTDAKETIKDASKEPIVASAPAPVNKTVIPKVANKPLKETKVTEVIDKKVEETKAVKVIDKQAEETQVAKIVQVKPSSKPEPEPKIESKPELKPEPKIELKAEPEPEVKPEPQPDPQELRLSEYVRDATDFLSPARLSESRLDAATRIYKSAYILAPEDRRVQRLPEQIASGLEVLADEARLKKNWTEASRLADKGLTLLPDHRGLKTLIANINRDKEAASESVAPRRAFGGF